MNDDVIKILSNWNGGVRFGGGPAVQNEAAELAAYRALGTFEELSELVEAKQEGRLVVLEKPALNENSPKPKCFYKDNGSRWCFGLAQGDDDYPINNCQKCFFCEFNAEEREEAEAALVRRAKYGVDR